MPGVEQHLALVMEYAACGSLTSYVAEQWQRAQHSGLFLSEDEARYFFRVCLRPPTTQRGRWQRSYVCCFTFGAFSGGIGVAGEAYVVFHLLLPRF